MSDSYDKNPQRLDQDASTVRDPIGSQHGAIENMNEQFFRSPPDNLGLGREQDRASDLVGARGTEPIADPPTAEEMARVKKLADQLNQ
ncbi:uncharacterized protein JCM10292_003592 [Rhodotorula paludigena]|uniref:uncharacterized protein n=1 Tax=Rhodotorula paludigena TaxID=86838 RepID=UPI00316C849E